MSQGLVGEEMQTPEEDKYDLITFANKDTSARQQVLYFLLTGLN